ncbi:MAG: peptidoglycan-binding protein [Terriglobales bacterium]
MKRALAIALLALLLPAQAPKKPAKKKKTARSTHSAVGIAPARARQIEDALVSAGYLDKASGRWDAASLAAMKKYQVDHHWQIRFIPDARALIALGLGPAPTTTASAGGG